MRTGLTAAAPLNQRLTADLLKSRAKTIMEGLVNDHSDPTFPKLAPLIDASAVFTHSDWPGNERDALFKFLSGLTAEMPRFHVEIKDMIAEFDETGGQVWIFSRITGGPEGDEVDSVDMMVFNDQGILIRSKDVQRAISKQ